MKGSAAAPDHFRALVEVLEDLSLDGVSLLRHDYHPQVFGSFEIVLGRGHERLRFAWDGRESILSLSFAEIENDSAAPVWAHDADFSLPQGEGLYAEIASQTSNMFSI